MVPTLLRLIERVTAQSLLGRSEYIEINHWPDTDISTLYSYSVLAPPDGGRMPGKELNGGRSD